MIEKKQLKENNRLVLYEKGDTLILNFKTNKYPLGLIMANARRIGKEIR